jgi:hypothetical protein
VQVETTGPKCRKWHWTNASKFTENIFIKIKIKLTIPIAKWKGPGIVAVSYMAIIEVTAK